MRLISCIIGLVIAALSGTASAAWTAIGQPDEIYAAYADTASIHRTGSLARMQGLYDFRRQDYTPEGKALFSTVVLREYDCDKRQVRLLSAIDFSGPMGGGTAVSTSGTPRRWEAVVAGGIDEHFWNAACSLK
jgi:hypothetical protein